MAMRVIAFALLVAAAPGAAAEEPMTPADTKAIEQLIHDYIMAHPEVILDSVRAMETRDGAAAAAGQAAAIAEHKTALIADPADPVAGNPEARFTVVEFFDYRCPYCKSVAKDFMAMIEADGDLRVVFKEFPILGPESEYAASAALAANAQGKYLDFHMAMMTSKGELSEQGVLDLAKGVGLDLDRLRRDMQAPAIAATIARNIELARALQITGTPAFVLGDRLIPGAVDMSEMKAAIEAERKG